jgi:hypothetical protein
MSALTLVGDPISVVVPLNTAVVAVAASNKSRTMLLNSSAAWRVKVGEGAIADATSMRMVADTEVFLALPAGSQVSVYGIAAGNISASAVRFTS